MAEPATGRPLAEPASNGAESSDGRLGELQRLLVGPELAQIARLQKRLDDPELRAQDLSQILAMAKIRKSFEQLIKAMFKRDPELVAAAVTPIVLLSVKKAVADALRDFTESLNHIAEKSVSLRALAWRFEAYRTRGKFSDIVLSRSLLYSVREVFLIHGKTGVLLQQVAREAVTKDPDMISSMFAAIQAFVRDSFVGTENKELETIGVGSFKLWIQHGPQAMVAGAVDGTPPPGLKGVFRGALDDVEKNFAAELKSFQGETSPFAGARPILERCLLGQSGPKPRRPLVPALVAGALVAGLALWITLAVIDNQRWQGYLRKLGAEPGIVLTGVEKQGSSYAVFGLRDQLARDPAGLLQGTGIPAANVKFRLEPYQSLDPHFVAARSFDSDKNSIERYVIRFQPGKSEIGPPELDNIDEIAAHVRSLFEAANPLSRSVRIELTGHTDELGPEDVNAHLAQDRASRVAAALVAAGVDRRFMTTRGVATSEPVRSGPSDRDLSFNRSVSFRVKANP